MSIFFNLVDPLNKRNPTDIITKTPIEGISEEIGVLELKMSDEDLITLATEWDSEYKNYVSKIDPKRDLCESYYLGTNSVTLNSANQERPSSENVIFEAVETLLPSATAKNPEPLIEASKEYEYIDPQTNEITAISVSDSLMVAIPYIADETGLNSEAKKMLRNWMTSFVGVLRINWNVEKNIPEQYFVNAKYIEMDKNGYVDNCGIFHGEYVKEIKKQKARDLIEKFPKFADKIKKEVGGKLGTVVTYYCYYTKDYYFEKYKDMVLAKGKNPFFYHSPEEGENHMEKTVPFVFFNCFSDGTQPIDVTGLVWQVIPLQDKLNDINYRISENLRMVNNSIVIDPDFASEEQAKRASVIMSSETNMLYLPPNAVTRLPPPQMGAEIFNQRVDLRNQIKSIFGVYGSTAQTIQQDKTVRGKIMGEDMDNSRIGGGISYQLERTYDTVFNFYIQLMRVMLKDNKEFVFGGKSATFNGSDLTGTILVSVKDNSLVPHNPMVEAQQAVDLFAQGALDPKTLYEKQGFSNPDETMKRLIEYKSGTGIFAPEMPMQPQMPQQLPPMM